MTATALWAGAAWWAGSMTWEFRLLALALVIPWFLFGSKKHEREFLKKKFYALKGLKISFTEKRLLKPSRV